MLNNSINLFFSNANNFSTRRNAFCSKAPSILTSFRDLGKLFSVKKKRICENVIVVIQKLKKGQKSISFGKYKRIFCWYGNVLTYTKEFVSIKQRGEVLNSNVCSLGKLFVYFSSIYRVWGGWVRTQLFLYHISSHLGKWISLDSRPILAHIHSLFIHKYWSCKSIHFNLNSN
jgi:hypothetical protein